MIGIQYLVHARWYQIPLIRIVRKITRHTSLSTICPVEIKYSHRLFSPWFFLVLVSWGVAQAGIGCAFSALWEPILVLTERSAKTEPLPPINFAGLRSWLLDRGIGTRRRRNTIRRP